MVIREVGTRSLNQQGKGDVELDKAKLEAK
jgi:hypothetical protein